MQEVFLMISEMNDLATVISYKKIKQHHHYPRQRENFTSEWNERLHKWAERTSSQARLTGIGEDVKKTFGFEWRAAAAAWSEALRLRSPKIKAALLAAWIFGGGEGSWTPVPARIDENVYMFILSLIFFVLCLSRQSGLAPDYPFYKSRLWPDGEITEQGYWMTFNSP